jgi:uncharacterized membrane protein
MSSIFHIAAGIAIIFFLPGFTFVNLLFPRRGELDPEYDIIYRITLGMGVSVVISILVGFMLNAMSTEGHGYVTAGPLWAVLLSITGLFTLVGWLRGAYPRAGLIHPRLYRSTSIRGIPRTKGLSYNKKKRTEKLVLEREALLADLKALVESSSTSNPQRKLYYRQRIDDARGRVDQINEELRSLGGGKK